MDPSWKIDSLDEAIWDGKVIAKFNGLSGQPVGNTNPYNELLIYNQVSKDKYISTRVYWDELKWYSIKKWVQRRTWW